MLLLLFFNNIKSSLFLARPHHRIRTTANQLNTCLQNADGVIVMLERSALSLKPSHIQSGGCHGKYRKKTKTCIKYFITNYISSWKYPLLTINSKNIVRCLSLQCLERMLHNRSGHWLEVEYLKGQPSHRVSKIKAPSSFPKGDAVASQEFHEQRTDRVGPDCHDTGVKYSLCGCAASVGGGVWGASWGSAHAQFTRDRRRWQRDTHTHTRFQPFCLLQTPPHLTVQHQGEGG